MSREFTDRTYLEGHSENSQVGASSISSKNKFVSEWLANASKSESPKVLEEAKALELCTADKGIDRAAARRRVVQFTADELNSAKDLKATNKAGMLVRAALAHQYEWGGLNPAKATDSMAKDISDKLKDGMKLKIVDDPAYTKKVKDNYKKDGKEPPDYIRWVELVDKNGKSLGGFGIGLKRRKRDTELDV